VVQASQVFVSHASDMAEFPESRSFVQAALDAVCRALMSPVDMRYFAVRDEPPADYCRRRVGKCDVYVAVVGFRYGSVVPVEGCPTPSRSSARGWPGCSHAWPPS
jgi:hypothetical protein